MESYDNYPGCEKMIRWLTRCGGFPPKLGSCTTPPPQERWNGYRVRWAASLLKAVDVTTSHHRYLSGHNHESPEEDVYKANKVLFLRAIIIFPIATTPCFKHIFKLVLHAVPFRPYINLLSSITMGQKIPEKQWAQVFEKSNGPIEYKQVPVPTPGPDEVLINIKYTGVCHTDLHVRGSYLLAI